MYLDVLRGPHSTGVATISLREKKDELHVLKSLGQPYELYAAHPHHFKDGIVRGNNLDCIIGHNRYATQGAVTVDNAHPFEFPNLIGVHNGTVEQWSLVNFHQADQYVVDSQIIFSELSHNNDLQKIWDKAWGAMALVWWDKRDRCLHVANNGERPLHFAYTQDKSTMFWASERWMLDVALGKSSLKTSPVQSFKKNTHYTFDLFDPQIVVTETELIDNNTSFVSDDSFYSAQLRPAVKVVVEVVEYNQIGEKGDGIFFARTEIGKEVGIKVWANAKGKHSYEYIMGLVEAGTPYFSVNWNHVFNLNGTDMVSTHSVEHLPNVRTLKPQVKEQERIVADFFGQPITRRVWRAANSCCGFCDKQVAWKEAHKIKWVTEDVYICDDCKDEPLVQEWFNPVYAKAAE